jgi:hypothetical protein
MPSHAIVSKSQRKPGSELYFLSLGCELQAQTVGGLKNSQFKKTRGKGEQVLEKRLDQKELT